MLGICSRASRATAVLYGVFCHSLFLLGIGLAFVAMYKGMHLGFVRLDTGWAILLDSVLLLQFPLLHSFLLSGPGGRFLKSLAPQKLGSALSTTTFTIIASVQLIALYGLWAPLAPVWWESQGVSRAVISVAYLLSWLLLAKAMADAGLATQTGFLGWSAVFQGQKPVYEPMPIKGLFRYCRQPIYLAFALTTWTVPVWSLDQLILALWLTSYCLLGPIFKERRYRKRYGEAFTQYKDQVPYIVPKQPQCPF